MLINLVTFGIIPQFVPTFWTTVEICVAMGGLLLAVIAMKKKKMSQKLGESQQKEEINRRNASLAEKYKKEHPESFGTQNDKKENKLDV